MSPWWPNILHIYVARTHIGLATSSGVFNHRSAHARTIPCAVATGADPRWTAVLSALEREIQRFTSHRTRIVLSDHWCRYAAFPKRNGISGHEELRRYAAHKMRSLYGAVADAWNVRICSAGSSYLACGIDEELIAALQRLAVRRPPWRLSIQPAFAALANEHRARIEGDDAWFVMREDNEAVLARVGQHNWQSVVTRRLHDRTPIALFAALERECRLQQIPQDESVRAYVAENNESRDSCDYAHPHYRIRRLTVPMHWKIQGAVHEMAA